MKTDRIGKALKEAMNHALLQPECEVRVSFKDKAERTEASRRFMELVHHEILPGVKSGSFLFDPETSTETQIELKNGSCILLLEDVE